VSAAQFCGTLHGINCASRNFYRVLRTASFTALRAVNLLTPLRDIAAHSPPWHAHEIMCGTQNSNGSTLQTSLLPLVVDLSAQEQQGKSTEHKQTVQVWQGECSPILRHFAPHQGFLSLRKLNFTALCAVLTCSHRCAAFAAHSCRWHAPKKWMDPETQPAGLCRGLYSLQSALLFYC
jgi:hypothetical protein